MFNATLERYLGGSVGDSVCNLKKFNRGHIIDTKTIKYPTSGGYLLPIWKIECNDAKAIKGN